MMELVYVGVRGGEGGEGRLVVLCVWGGGGGGEAALSRAGFYSTPLLHSPQ